MNSNRIMFQLTAVATIVCLSAIAEARTTYQGHFERTYQLNGAAQLEIDAGSSDLTVHSGPAGQVLVSGKIHVGDRWLFGGRTAKVDEIEKNPPVRQDGNTIHIDRTQLNDISVDYEITVPADTRVRSHLGSGDVKMQDLKSEIELQSGSGDVWLENISGKIQTRSGSGDVHATGINGSFSADASSGDIRLEERGKGDIEIRTTSGNIEVQGASGALHLEAGSGDVTVEGSPNSVWEARAGSGNIHFSVPRDSAFQLDGSTSSGELRINHSVTMTIQGNLDAARHSVKGAVGSGGPMVTVHTGSGDIDID